MNKLFVVLLMSACLLTVKGQDFDNIIFFREFNSFINCNKVDTIYSIRNSNKRIDFFLQSPLGKAVVKEYDKKNRILSERNYESALDTFKRYVVEVNPITLEINLIVQKYFEPILSGELLLYNKKGVVITKLKCKYGVCN